MAKEIKRIGRCSFVETSAGQFAIHMGWDNQFSVVLDTTGESWDKYPTYVGGARVVPWGAMNDFPERLRNLLERNNVGPGILDRKTGLLYGEGPMLCRYVMRDGQPTQEWTEDKEVQRWLDSWDYKRYVREVLVEYTRTNGHFTRYVMGKGVRIGRSWVSRLECLPSGDVRMVWPESDRLQLDQVKQFIVGDFARNCGFAMYPVFDKWNPARHEAAIGYHSLRSFGRNLYALSSFYGSIPWLQNANDLPEIIRHLNENLIAAAYVVHMPQEYIRQKEELVRLMHPEWTDEQVVKELEKLREQVTQTIADVMAGKQNAGKFFQCVDFIDMDGHAQSWKIEPIEMNIDKYIEAQVKISRIADSSTTSGFGLSPALANIIIDGKSDSGSQMLYALKIFYGADTHIPEEIALEALNDALHINFPTKRDLFVGLYRKIINKEENVTTGNRVTQNI